MRGKLIKADISSNKNIAVILSIISIALEAVLKILIESPLKFTLAPLVEWLNYNGFLEALSFIFLFTFYVIIGLYTHNFISLKIFGKYIVLLGVMILFAIYLLWLLAILKSTTWIFIPLLALMALAIIAARISPSVLNGGSLIKSLFFAVPAISLGVALGSSGFDFAVNMTEYGTPFADATLVVVDHFNNPSLSGNYPMKATRYDVIRDDNEIKISIQGTPLHELLHVSKDIDISFEGISIPPDGNKRSFILEGSKRYKLILT